MNTRILFTFFVFFSFSLDAVENQTAKTDILFLKIQELELEIAELRNKIESQNYLIEKLINDRNQARTSKDFNKADKIRNKLSEMGIEIEDTPNGTIWRSK